jgi:hypothetical protein
MEVCVDWRASQEHLARTICDGLKEGHCALCQTAIQNYLEEIVCPHWFLKNGARGFHLKRLVRIFQVYDLDSVLHYLRVVAELERRADEQLPFQEFFHADQRVVAIVWRKRSWIFQQPVTSLGEYSTHEFTISSFHLGQMIEKGTILIGPRLGEAAVIPLIHTQMPNERSWERAEQALFGLAKVA